jgi:MFS family permease
MKINLHNGWKSFLLIWSGQTVSLVGTAMSRFGLMIWAYQQTGAATTTALLGFFNYITMVASAPLAGLVVDRVRRKTIMLLADSLAACMSAIALYLFHSGSLQIWHLYGLIAVSGICDAFQYPALNASISLMLPADQLTRASSLNGLADNGSRILAPVLAGILLPIAGIQALLIIDLVTFAASLVTMLLASVPQPTAVNLTNHSLAGSLADIRIGWRFIHDRKGLLGLALVFSAINLFAGLTYYSIITAMILSKSGQNPRALSLVEASLGVGGIVGGLILTVWGGPKSKVRGLLLATGVSFLLGDGMFCLGRSLPFWMLAGFISNLFIPFITAPNQAIWQCKVPPEIQGRVFSLRGMMQMATIPLGYLLAGPLADHVFEPGMRVGGNLAHLFGWLAGTGPGSGMGLMFACTAISGCLTAIISYSVPAVRHVENDLPDTNSTISENSQTNLDPNLERA